MTAILHFHISKNLATKLSKFPKQIGSLCRQKCLFRDRNKFSAENLAAVKRTSLALLPALLKRFEWKRKAVKNKDGNSSTATNHLPADQKIEISFNGLKLTDLWSVLKSHFGWLLAIAVSAVALGLLNISVPILTGQLVDVVANFLRNDQGNGDVVSAINALSQIAFKLATNYAAQAILSFGIASYVSIIGERIAADLRLKLFSALLHKDMTFYGQNGLGNIIQRYYADIEKFKSSFKTCVFSGLTFATRAWGCAGSLYKISPQMTVWAKLAIFAWNYLSSVVLFCLYYKLPGSIQKHYEADVLSEALTNIKTVRSFAMENAEHRLYAEEVTKALQSRERACVGVSFILVAQIFFMRGLSLGLLYGGSKLILTNEISAGDLMAFLLTDMIMYRSFQKVNTIFTNVLHCSAAGARIFQFIRMPVSSEMSKGGLSIARESLKGDINFEAVTYKHPIRSEHTLLNDINLHIGPGTVIALCDSSAEPVAGSVWPLLERVQEPNSGRITIDGQDIKEFDVEWLRGQAIGVISFKSVLFSTTIAENIRYGKPEASDQEVESAAVEANADSFIRELPDGYKTVLGKRGVRLSADQQKRLAIARVLLKNPPIIILDDTSGPDSDSEKLVDEALDKAVQGRTVIIIAGRLSTLQKSQLVAVFDNGKIAEMGTHNELIENRGVYWQFIQSKFGS